MITVRDERGRRKRLRKDVLGRLTRVEELNWDGSVYATAWYSYNGRDQLVQINHEGQVRTFEYDGHGRLWRRTTPEQGQTIYSYNADDTVNTITDARGASQTFQYNGRHLVTAINYGVPQGVARTANVQYGYDEAGDRVWMEDGMGRVDYEYDVLGRLVAETRYFSELNGSYTLQYSYDLAGELTSVTNPWGVVVGYSRDQAGQVVAVTGANYGGVTVYAQNVRYRAFGAVKQVSYGNGRQQSVAYDNRLRVSRWEVVGVLGWEYGYDDFGERSGRVTFARNLYDNRLDRSWEYDQVGRLIHAYSGEEARAHVGRGEWGSPTGPYAHSYEYDVCGNMVRRVGWGGWAGAFSVS